MSASFFNRSTLKFVMSSPQYTIANKSAESLAKRYGTQYTIGTIAETICKYICVLVNTLVPY